MKYLKVFETTAAFEAVESTLDKPNVSLIEATNGINYLPYIATDPYNGHDYVEIGGLKWATMNVGANSITDYGLYFQWGDTQGYTASQVGSGAGKKHFTWEDYKYGTFPKMTKYNTTDSKTVLEASDDAAQANWGGEWRMPTAADFQALLAATTNALTSITVDNITVYGRQFTDKTDSSKKLFFPAASYCYNNSVNDIGSYGIYWTSSLASDVTQGRYLHFYNNYCYMTENGRCYGCTVRGVVG